jgi:hypothetical protein
MSGAASGDWAMSESEDVPGLSFAFFEGDGLSTGPGVLAALTTLGFSGSSVIEKVSRCASMSTTRYVECR